MKKNIGNIVCHDLEGRKYSIPKNRLRFRPGAYAIIIRNGSVLLTAQWDGYDLPGGGVDLGETLEAAAKREVWEETGYRVEIGKILAADTVFYRFKYSDAQAKRYGHCFMNYFTARITGGKPSIKNFDRHEKKYAGPPEWIKLTDLNKIKIYNSLGQKRIIDIIRSAHKARTR